MPTYSADRLERYFSLIALPNWKTLLGQDDRRRQVSRDQTLKVEFKKLAPTAMSKPVWIYSMRFGGEDKPWKEMYAFADAEFLPSDFDVLNYYTLHASPFTRIVVVQSLFFDRLRDSALGTLSLVNDRVTENVRCEEELLATLKNESERVEAFEKHFGIKLSQEELHAIQGSAYALPPTSSQLQMDGCYEMLLH
ncbi:hypothetical protein PWT90_02166 [Aphanocladium album]|nr:hypothetical protein PWT90_02166 [Aphanocladium album]